MQPDPTLRYALNDTQRSYWRRTLSITAVLLLLWFVATFVVAWYAVPLAQTAFFGWPLSYYMLAQGSLIVYLVILYVYSTRMRRLDRTHGVAEEQ